VKKLDNISNHATKEEENQENHIEQWSGRVVEEVNDFYRGGK
jgi:hypothetical protein